jgi:hypothetical protein
MRAKITASKQQIVDVYAIGFAQAIKCFAHWRDGTQYVGTTGTTLKDATDNIYTNPYFMPNDAMRRAGINIEKETE